MQRHYQRVNAPNPKPITAGIVMASGYQTATNSAESLGHTRRYALAASNPAKTPPHSPARAGRMGAPCAITGTRASAATVPRPEITRKHVTQKEGKIETHSPAGKRASSCAAPKASTGSTTRRRRTLHREPGTKLEAKQSPTRRPVARTATVLSQKSPVVTARGMSDRGPTKASAATASTGRSAPETMTMTTEGCRFFSGASFASSEISLRVGDRDSMVGARLPVAG